ncbi:hypothetical protein K505DRAFT_344167 [Melanomma pulvis-pyrius CBS 109.77]|uniref:Uncharacterized protein n=1 Tax=Melanomma pulvis-pyrius CBS 109.77 TaxID=1314802 RepID=A0A6A6WQ87_9PLEO|nr:hypothetical protein K505DRAFT_344167 [Melanomma pulvis-pyrius CBS 109.77]
MSSQDSRERTLIPGLIMHDLSTWVSKLHLPPAGRREKKQPHESIKKTLAGLAPSKHEAITPLQFETFVFWRKLCYPPLDDFHQFLESLDLPKNVHEAIDDNKSFQTEAVKVFQTWLDGTRGPTMSSRKIRSEKNLRRIEILELAEVYADVGGGIKLQQLEEGQNTGE